MFTEQQLEDYGPKNKPYQVLRNSEESMDMKRRKNGEQSVTKDSQMIHAVQFAVVLEKDHNALHGHNLKTSSILIFTIQTKIVLIMFQFSFQILKRKIHLKVMTAAMLMILS